MAALINRYPLWKYLLIVAVLLAAFIYAAPNLYGEFPAVQIKGTHSVLVDNTTLETADRALRDANINYQGAVFQDQTLIFRFASTDTQLKAKDIIQNALGDNFLTALNLAPATPNWMRKIGAAPMKLGLDLRGGVHFLLQVDVDSVIQQRVEGDMRGIGQALREERIRYSGVTRKGDNQVILQFKTEDAADSAFSFVNRRYSEFTWDKQTVKDNVYVLQGTLAPAALFQMRQEILEQSMNTLRNRVNELGVSEAIVQQQGESRISVDLPGIQDTAEAKNIIGKTATLELHMVDVENDARSVASEGGAPSDTRLYDYHGQPLLLKNQIVLRGSSIVAATSGFGEDGRPNVQVRLSGAGESLFTKITSENVGKPMAVVYIDVKPIYHTEDGKQTITYQTERRIISVATIQSALGSNFQITGLNAEEARTLALLLRAGALPASVAFIEERQVGPSLGQQNIHMGVLSVELGMGLVIIFMALYYGLMGVIADLALAMNLVLIIAILSLLGATLTLPGIAGIVLTVGMAVDANVLIFERIREELRRGMGVQASIHAGYERAFVTILDANITTLIVMMILFSLGSGVVKGLAITVTVGLITSMFTAITGTRALVNLIYGGRSIKRISIGI